MAYRDPAAAARERVRQAREEMERFEERITPTLLAQMGHEDRDALERLADALSEALPDELEGLGRDQLLAALPLIADYQAALEQAIEEAPRLAKRYNRLPRTFPARQRLGFRYEMMDIYSPDTAQRRDETHGWIRELDAEANILSARRSYDNETMEPFLAEAELTVERAPLRLQVQARHAVDASHQGLPLLASRAYGLFVKTRRSTPRLRLDLQGLDDRLLKWLRLKSEPSIGHPAFDDMYFIQGTEQDARRLLRPEVLEPLMTLAAHRKVSLTVDDGVAGLEWIDDSLHDSGLTSAVQALVAIRNTPPVRLLRPRRAVKR